MLGNRAIYHDGWIASTTPPQPPWLMGLAKMPDVVNGYKWELYNIAEDFSQSQRPRGEDARQAARDAGAVPGRGGEVPGIPARQRRPRPVPDAEAELHRRPHRVHLLGRAVRHARTATRPTSWPSPTASPPRWKSPRAAPKGCSSPTAAASAATALYLLKGKPVFTYNLLDLERFRWEGQDALAPGKHTIVFDFNYDGPGFGKGGTGVLKVDGKEVATQEDPAHHPVPADDRRDLRRRHRHPHAGGRQGLLGACPDNGRAGWW